MNAGIVKQWVQHREHLRKLRDAPGMDDVHTVPSMEKDFRML
jgi:hypothetical protein